jgi:amidohydrolase
MIHLKIKEFLQQNKAAMIAFRRQLHKNPELSWEEVQTTKDIAAQLDETGIPYKLTEPTGLIAEIKGGKPGKTIALRADIDALPVQEFNDHIDYKSQIDGKMHACGHDTHTAMLLFAAKALYQIKDELNGNVRLIFQPAEETALGALAMIKQGAIENVDAIFGMHNWPAAPSGKISCYAGSSFASADFMKIRFIGQGGHGSLPHNCTDAIMVASSFVMNLQSIVSREIDPLEPAVVTIGKLEAGTRFNVIAETAYLEGTVRCFNIATRDKISAAITRYAEQTAAAYGAKAEVEYIYGTLPVINDEQSANLANAVINESFGEHVIFREKPTTGGEDFSFYTENIPGAFALVGSAGTDKSTQWGLHHGSFNVDEDSMLIGAELYAQYAWAYLNQNQF